MKESANEGRAKVIRRLSRAATIVVALIIIIDAASLLKVSTVEVGYVAVVVDPIMGLLLRGASARRLATSSSLFGQT